MQEKLEEVFITDRQALVLREDFKSPHHTHRDWTASEENLIDSWVEDSSTFMWLHERTAASYSKYHNILTLPIMLITASTGSANVAMAFYNQSNWISNLATGIVGVGSSILTAISHFYKFSELAETHKQTAYSWNKLRASMLVQLAIHYDDRSDCKTFMETIRDEMDRLYKSSPQIPEQFILEFERKRNQYS